MLLKQLLAATAIATIATATQAAQPTVNATAGANAATTVLPATGQVLLPAATSGDHLATKLIGAAVYESDAADAQSIGNINDIVIADNGAVSAVVVGVGGFLGIGQKNVALDFTSLHWTTRDDGPVLVASATKDDLNNAPAFDTAALDQPVPADGTAPVDQTASNVPATDATGAATTDQVPADDTLAQQAAPDAGTAAPADQTQVATQTPVPAAGATTDATGTDQTQMAAQTPAPAASGTSATIPNSADLQPVDVATISAKDLMNATVYSGTNENVGEVSDVILAEDGKIDAVVLDVGGFLGLGEKPVAIGFDGLDIRKDANGALFVYTKFSKDQLEAAPQYDKDAYSGSRDTMRLTSPS
ncbi:MAG: PRC-barrel domain-containing protein [Bauldia sp.]